MAEFFLCFWPYGQEFESFITQVNNAVDSIKIAVVKEVVSFLAFLNVKVLRNNSNFLFHIYRKETHSDVYVHWFNNHSRSIKRGCALVLFLRGFRICDDCFLKDRRGHIQNL